MESTLHTRTIFTTLPRPRRFTLARIAAALRHVMRRARTPEAAALPPHLRRDVGLPPEVHRPTHAPPRVF
jgi:hypothetical protein